MSGESGHCILGLLASAAESGEQPNPERGGGTCVAPLWVFSLMQKRVGCTLKPGWAFQVPTWTSSLDSGVLMRVELALTFTLTRLCVGVGVRGPCPSSCHEHWLVPRGELNSSWCGGVPQMEPQELTAAASSLVVVWTFGTLTHPSPPAVVPRL